MPDTLLLGEKIRQLRQAQKLTQAELAAKLSVCPQAVSNWERGLTPPDIDNLVRISDELGVTVDFLLKRSAEDCLLAIDGGGTKTEFVVFTARGYVLKRFSLSASNPNDIGFEACCELVASGMDTCLAAQPGITRVFCAIAGIGTGNNRANLLKKLSARYPGIAFESEPDAACSLSIDKSCGMALICGTGSVVFARRAEGAPIRVGGWGYLFDEAGSAYDIGRDAIRAALAELDGMGEKTRISALLAEKLGGGLWENLNRIYAGGKTLIASFAPLVFEAYASGDPAAHGIIDRNMRRLALLCNTAAAQHGAALRVIAGGGLFAHYREIMLKHLQKYTEAEFIFSDLPPIYGVCCRCCELFAIPEEEDFHENFKATYLA